MPLSLAPRCILPALALALAFGLAAPAAQAQEPPLRSAMDATFAPHAMPKISGGLEGMNVDVAEEMAKRIGRKVEIEGTQFAGLIPAMQAGKYDFLTAGVTVTEERAKQMLFIEGFVDANYRFYTLADKPEVTDVAGFKDQIIAVQKGTIYEQWVNGQADKLGWKTVTFGTSTDVAQAVISGRAYAAVTAQTVAEWIVKNNPRLKNSYVVKTGLVWSMPLRIGNEELRRKLDGALECMKKDGTLKAIYVKWFKVDPPEGSAATVIFPGYGPPGMPNYDPTEHTPPC